MVTFVCYPKCTTCQKAQKWLDDHGVAYTLRHIKDDKPSYEELVEAFGTPEEMGAALLTAVSSKEQITYTRFSRGVEIAANVAVIALVLLTVYVLLTPLNIRIVDAIQKDSYIFWPRG